MSPHATIIVTDIWNYTTVRGGVGTRITYVSQEPDGSFFHSCASFGYETNPTAAGMEILQSRKMLR